MLKDYLRNRYKDNEPILMSEIKIDGISDANLRQQLKKLTDAGILRRYDTGVYYFPKITIFRCETQPSRDAVIKAKYLRDGDKLCGYVSGIAFANQLGLTTQVPAVTEVFTNKATNEYRETTVGKVAVIVRRPKTEINKDNYKALQLMDVLKDINDMAELPMEETGKRIIQYMKNSGLSFSMIKPYLTLYPDRMYKNLYEMGLLDSVLA